MRAVIDLAKKNAPHTLKIEVEVTTVEEANEAVEAGADIVMLDNMSVEEMRRAVKSMGGRVLVEASGGDDSGQRQERGGDGSGLDLGRCSDSLGESPGHQPRNGDPASLSLPGTPCDSPTHPRPTDTAAGSRLDH